MVEKTFQIIFRLIKVLTTLLERWKKSIEIWDMKIKKNLPSELTRVLWRSPSDLLLVMRRRWRFAWDWLPRDEAKESLRSTWLSNLAAIIGAWGIVFAFYRFRKKIFHKFEIVIKCQNQFLLKTAGLITRFLILNTRNSRFFVQLLNPFVIARICVLGSQLLINWVQFQFLSAARAEPLGLKRTDKNKVAQYTDYHSNCKWTENRNLR